MYIKFYKNIILKPIYLYFEKKKSNQINTNFMKADCLTTTDPDVGKCGEQTGLYGSPRSKRWILGLGVEIHALGNTISIPLGKYEHKFEKKKNW